MATNGGNKYSARRARWSGLWLASVTLFASALPRLASADPSVMISGFNDISLGIYGGSLSQLMGTDELCIYNRDSDLYSLRFTTNTGSAVMTGPSTSLPFTLQFQALSGAWESLDYDDLSPPNFSGANSVTTSCGGGTNAAIRVVINQNDLLMMRPGSFLATVVVTLSPG